MSKVIPFPKKTRPEQMERWTATGALYEPPAPNFPWVGVVVLPDMEPTFVHAPTEIEADRKLMAEISFRDDASLSESVRQVYSAFRRLQGHMRRRINPEGKMTSEDFEDYALAEIDDERVNAALDAIAENLEIDPIDEDYDPDEPFEPDWDAADRPTTVPH